MGEDREFYQKRREFYERRTEISRAVRRDARLSLAARVLGQELLDWWLFERQFKHVYGMTEERLSEILGISRATIRAGKAQLQTYGYFQFQRTGRYDRVWPASIPAEMRTLNFSAQNAENQHNRTPDSGAPNNKDNKDRRELPLRPPFDRSGGQDHGRRKSSGSARSRIP